MTYKELACKNLKTKQLLTAYNKIKDLADFQRAYFRLLRREKTKATQIGLRGLFVRFQSKATGCGKDSYERTRKWRLCAG
jgi:hypothetical protein